MSSQEYEPTKRDRLRPLELLGLSLVISVFAAVVVGFSTRDWKFLVPVIGLGVFVVCVLLFALLSLTFTPNQQDIEARKSLQHPQKSQDAEGER